MNIRSNILILFLLIFLNCFILNVFGNKEKPVVRLSSRGNMVLIPGGEFEKGSDAPWVYVGDGESPTYNVSVSDFYMDETEVSIAQFHRFVQDTGYVTQVEREFGWSFCFEPHLSRELAEQISQHVQAASWWIPVDGATWMAPEGPDSKIDFALPDNPRLQEPVVHVTFEDADAYCRWKKGKLPTEAQWEYAARGGRRRKTYCWGDKFFSPTGQYRCNIFQGDFPFVDSAEDGYAGRAPVKSFDPNRFGLYNMCGNVWEWTDDYFTSRPSHVIGRSLDPLGPATGDKRVQKGGSFMCTFERCFRFRPAARVGNTPDSSSANVGFRCARPVKKPNVSKSSVEKDIL